MIYVKNTLSNIECAHGINIKHMFAHTGKTQGLLAALAACLTDYGEESHTRPGIHDTNWVQENDVAGSAASTEAAMLWCSNTALQLNTQ